MCANFAFDLAARRTTDADMAGFDLGDVLAISNGAERVNPATIKRFNERFARFNLKDTVIRPSYGLAEATLWVAAPRMGRPSRDGPFRLRALVTRSSEAVPATALNPGTDLVSYGTPRMCTVRIVDPESKTENPPGTIREIWVHGDNVARGYWQNPWRPNALSVQKLLPITWHPARILAEDRRPRRHVR